MEEKEKSVLLSILKGPPLITPLIKNELSLLVVSDLHQQESYLDMLSQLIISKRIIYDAIICTGDLVSYPNVGKENQRQEKKALLEPFSCRALQLMSSWGQVIIFVPGNHDLPYLYELQPKNVPLNFHSLTGNVLKLCDGLLVAGVHGSVAPITNKVELRPGYPFRGEKEFSQFIENSQIAELSEMLLQNTLAEKLEKKEDVDTSLDSSILMLSHGGSIHSLTTFAYRRNGRHVSQGTSSLSRFLMNPLRTPFTSRICLMIHGHTHDCPGYMEKGIISKEIASIEQKEEISDEFQSCETDSKCFKLENEGGEGCRSIKEERLQTEEKEKCTFCTSENAPEKDKKKQIEELKVDDAHKSATSSFNTSAVNTSSLTCSLDSSASSDSRYSPKELASQTEISTFDILNMMPFLTPSKTLPPILNPGPLRYGCFAVVTFCFALNKWIVSSVSQHDLSPF